MSLPNQSRRVMLLTGASRGIGHATVKRFSAAGWRVITCSRHAFPENCPWEMGPEDHIQVDLANARRHAAGHRRDARSGSRRRAPPHALVNNAGISPKGEGGARLGASRPPLQDWQHVFQVNFFAPIMLARGLIATSWRAPRARSSTSPRSPARRVHPFAGAAYATSKAALAALTREMAADFGPRGMRVNAISPGEIDTAILSPGTDKIVAADPAAAARRAGRGRQGHLLPVHRGQSYVNGAELHINGGQHV